MKRYALLLLVTLLVSACGVTKNFSDERAAVTPYDANSLWNLQLGRNYASQGRYELAKEHLLMALAASNDAEIRNVVAHELKSVDTMLKTQR